jgi:hypothetical protein
MKVYILYYITIVQLIDDLFRANAQQAQRNKTSIALQFNIFYAKQ